MITIPVLLNSKRSNRASWYWFRHSRQKFLNPFRYYRLADYVFALREAWRQTGMPRSPVYLNGQNVSRLFESERARTAFDLGSLDSLLSFRLPKRLAQAGYRVDLFVQEFENMIPEKMFVLGFQRYLTETKLVGFQHGALYPLLLCNFITHGEAVFAPMPDRVVCNGEFFREILIERGLPRDRVVVGPALRYTHLWNPINRQSGEREGTTRVLVTLPLMLDAAVELLTKVIHAFQNTPSLEILLKPHPMSREKELLSVGRLRQMPAHFRFVQGSMGEWLAQVSIAVAMSSSTIHEVLAAGIPVVVVGRQTALDLNPLGWYKDLDKVFYSQQEIRSEALRLLALSQKELMAYKQRAQEILDNTFSKVTDETMRAFVDGFVSTKEDEGGHNDGYLHGTHQRATR